MNFLDTYRKAIAVFAVLETILIVAIVSTWDTLAGQSLNGELYDVGAHDTSLTYLVFGTALSAIIGYAVDELSNRY